MWKKKDFREIYVKTTNSEEQTIINCQLNNYGQVAELFDTSKQTVSYHINNILNERELSTISVVKDSFTTAFESTK